MIKDKWKGLKTYRFKHNPLEEAFAREWQDQNDRLGAATLDYILDDRFDNNRPDEANERDRVVANTVIQWLGTPVGQSFLERVLCTEQASNFRSMLAESCERMKRKR